MNETEIRDRVRQALGESSVPPDFAPRLAVRLDRPAGRSQSPLLGIVAAVLALAIIGALIFIRLQSPTRLAPAGTPVRSPTVPTALGGNVTIPQFDLDQTQLGTSGDLVTPMNLSAKSSGRTVTLVGAYADSSRIVLFLRTLPDAGFPSAVIHDDSGFLNAGGEAGAGIVGDRFFVLHTAPHAGSDGTAHLRVVINSFIKVLPPEPQQPPPVEELGNWTFEFPIRAQASIHLRPAPPLTIVGSWNFSVEAFEVTPTVVHFQAVIVGAAVEDIKQNTFSLANTNGRSTLQTVALEASQAGTASTRVNIEWRRPVNGGTYFLVVDGKYQGAVAIDGTGTPAYVKGTPLAPTDYPTATEAITFDGAFSASVVYANPTSCGVGAGSSGTLFGLAMDFQVNQAWYMINLSTDPRVRQYTGPGTYDVAAQITPQGGSTIFVGTVRLTVTSDHYPGPFTGSARGTLTWTGIASQPQTVNIAGNWKCMPGGQLGPG